MPIPGRTLKLTVALLVPSLCGPGWCEGVAAAGTGNPPTGGTFRALMPTYPQRLVCLSPRPEAAARSLLAAFPRSDVTLVIPPETDPVAAGLEGGQEEARLSWAEGTVTDLALPDRHYNLVIGYDVAPFMSQLVRIAAVGATVCLGYSAVGSGISFALERRVRAADLTKVATVTHGESTLAAGIRFRPPTG